MSASRRLAAVTLGAMLALAACSGGGSSATPSEAPGGEEASGSVSIDGSSTVYPITEAVAEEFQKANGGATVTVNFSGTGGGFKKFCAGETDINDASRPIKADDEGEGKACETAGIEYVELQVAIDGLTVVLNPGNDWATCFTIEQLSKIYGPDSPADLTWADVDPSWPAEPVDRYMPGADSGTFDYFTEAVNGETDAATQDATQSEDDNFIVSGVAGNKYAIGFFGFAYFEENTDKLKAAEIDGGSGCIAPTRETINDSSYSPLSRPLFIYPSVTKAADSAVLVAFIDYYLANAGTYAAEVGYVEAPESVISAETAEWQAAIAQ